MENIFHLIVSALDIFVSVAALLGMVTGGWLLLSPGGFAKFEQLAGGPYSIRRRLLLFDISRSIDHYFYRNHHLIGLLIIVFSTYTLYRIMFGFPEDRVALLPFNLFPIVVAEWFASALRHFLLSSHLFAIIIGLLIYIRPSTIKNFETHANRWLTLRRQTAWLNRHREFMRGQPRVVGLALIVLSIYLISFISMR